MEFNQYCRLQNYALAFPKTEAIKMKGVVSAEDWAKDPNPGIDKLLAKWRKEHPNMTDNIVQRPPIKKQRKPKVAAVKDPKPVKAAKPKTQQLKRQREVTPKDVLNERRNARCRKERDLKSVRPYCQGKQIDANFTYNEFGQRVYEITTKPMTCTCCGKTKGAVEFPVDIYRPLGHRKICILCRHKKYIERKNKQ